MAELASISPGYVLAYDIAFYDNNLGEWISQTSLFSLSYTAYAITMGSCPGMALNGYGWYEIPSGFENQYTAGFYG